MPSKYERAVVLGQEERLSLSDRRSFCSAVDRRLDGLPGQLPSGKHQAGVRGAIAHQQLLAVRSSSALTTVTELIGAGEMLEWLGVEGLLGNRAERKRVVTNVVLGVLRDKSGRAVEMSDDRALDKMAEAQTWGLVPAAPDFVLPRLEGLYLMKSVGRVCGCLEAPAGSLAAAILSCGLTAVNGAHYMEGKRRGCWRKVE